MAVEGVAFGAESDCAEFAVLHDLKEARRKAFFDAEAFEGFAELATVFPVVRNDDTTRFGLSVDIQLYVSHAFPGMLVC